MEQATGISIWVIIAIIVAVIVGIIILSAFLGVTGPVFGLTAFDLTQMGKGALASGLGHLFGGD